MSSQPVEVEEPLANGITDEQIARLIQERKNAGAITCRVEMIDGKRMLVTLYPPL